MHPYLYDNAPIRGRREDTLMRLLRIRSVCERVGLSRSTVYAYVASKRFPPPLKLGPGEGGAVAWRESDVGEWIESRTSRTDESGRPAA